jgi:hypothetical protein
VSRIRDDLRTLLRLLLVLALLPMFTGCAREPDEEALRRIVTEMRAALEAGDNEAFLAQVTDDFSGQAGSVDAASLRRALAALKIRHERIRATTTRFDVKLFGDRATIDLLVLATGGGWFPETGQALEIHSSWRREDGDWKCFAAEWKEKL